LRNENRRFSETVDGEYRIIQRGAGDDHDHQPAEPVIEKEYLTEPKRNLDANAGGALQREL
jgi:hypothetical protein